jgi:hypothetical protein
MESCFHIVQYGKIAEKPYILEGPGQAQGGVLVGTKPCGLTAVKDYPAGGRTQDAGKEVEDRSLSRPVGAYEADQFTMGNLYPVTAQGFETSETLF